MEINCYKISFGRWKAELYIDGIIYGNAIGQRPACAIRDALNEFCLKHDGMPESTVKMTIVEWE